MYFTWADYKENQHICASKELQALLLDRLTHLHLCFEVMWQQVDEQVPVEDAAGSHDPTIGSRHEPWPEGILPILCYLFYNFMNRTRHFHPTRGPNLEACNHYDFPTPVGARPRPTLTFPTVGARQKSSAQYSERNAATYQIHKRVVVHRPWMD